MTLAITASLAHADYASIFIQHEGTDQAMLYDAATGKFDLVVEDAPLLNLDDPVPLPGPVQNATLHLVTTFDRVGVASCGEFALMRGGTISLTFEYDSGTGMQPHEISGRVQMLTALWTNYGPTDSKLDLFGAWFPETVNLPGSNVWPNQGKRSTIDGLSVAIPSGATSWNPESASITERTAVQASLLPDWGFLCCAWPSGDWDHDCDVDLKDFAGFTLCRHDEEFTAAQVWDCLDRLDLDIDAHVDERDLPLFVEGMTEPHAQPCEFRRNSTVENSPPSSYLPKEH